MTISFAQAADLHVAPDGADDRDGRTPANALRTIQRAADLAEPGDVVYVADGVYSEAVRVRKSGTPGKWITFRAVNRHGAKVAHSIEGDGINLDNANYIEIDGFEITVAGDGCGIAATFGHHTRILNNHIHHCGGGGIQTNKGDYRHIEGNILHHNAFNNYWQMSGISLWQAVKFDDAPGFHNRIIRNISYANENRRNGPGGMITDGNGIIIDDFRNTQYDSKFGPYTPATLVENNLCFDNGMKGIHVYLTDNVTVRNNTVYHNNRIGGGTWRGELSNVDAANNTWVNNIAVVSLQNNPENIAIGDMATKEGANAGTVWINNLTFNGKLGDASVRIENSQSQVRAEDGNLLGVDPKLSDPAPKPEADFRPVADSPAVGAATLKFGIPDVDFRGTTRSKDRPTIGAFEHALPRD